MAESGKRYVSGREEWRLYAVGGGLAPADIMDKRNTFGPPRIFDGA